MKKVQTSLSRTLTVLVLTVVILAAATTAAACPPPERHCIPAETETTTTSFELDRVAKLFGFLPVEEAENGTERELTYVSESGTIIVGSYYWWFTPASPYADAYGGSFPATEGERMIVKGVSIDTKVIRSVLVAMVNERTPG